MGHHHHHHGHGHHHHHHHVDPNAPVSRIFFAFILNLSFAVIEIIGGLLIGSMAIVADAVHDLGDSFSLGLALILQKKSSAGANAEYTYGYKRLSALSAVINASVLVIGSLLVVVNSVPVFFQDKAPPSGFGMIAFAVLGVAVNGFAAWRLSQGSSQNEKMLTWHMIEDVLGWVAVLVGAVVISFTGWTWVDPLLACAIALFILYNVLNGLRSNIRIFLQYIPENVDLASIQQQISNHSGIKSIENFHAWSLDGEEHVCTCVLTAQSEDHKSHAAAKSAIRSILGEHGFKHVTIEITARVNDLPLAETKPNA